MHRTDHYVQPGEERRERIGILLQKIPIIGRLIAHCARKPPLVFLPILFKVRCTTQQFIIGINLIELHLNNASGLSTKQE